MEYQIIDLRFTILQCTHILWRNKWRQYKEDAKKIESRLSLNQPLVVDGTGTLLDIYVYQSYQLENIEIKEFRDGLTLMEHMVFEIFITRT